MNRVSDVSSRVDRYIEGSETSFQSLEKDHVENEVSKSSNYLSVGASLLKITRQIENAFGGIILNTYINCLLQATCTLYAGSSFFFNNAKGIKVYILAANCFLMTFLSILRLFYYTKAGQHLATSIDECVETLKDLQMSKPDDLSFNYMKILKQDLKDKSVSPISPFGAFSLSNSTLIGTFATILTYLIVLIQFKASENQDNYKILHEMLRLINMTSFNTTSR